MEARNTSSDPIAVPLAPREDRKAPASATSPQQRSTADPAISTTKLCPTRALELSLSFAPAGDNRLHLVLDALFSFHMISRPGLFGTDFRAYNIQFGITGGELVVDLANAVCGLRDRLSGGEIERSVTVKVTGSEEQSREDGVKNAVSIGLDEKGLALGGADERTSLRKRGTAEATELSYNRPLLIPEGPEHKPSWRFNTARSGECLRGPSPGGIDSPLGTVATRRYPAEAKAVFRITSDQIMVAERLPKNFGQKYVPMIAVAKKALPRLVAKHCKVDGPYLIMAEATATAAIEAVPLRAANEPG